jgi:hypothetical protein
LDCATDLRQPALQAAERFDPDLTVLVSGSVVIRTVLAAGETLAPNSPGWLEELERGSSAFLFAMAQHTRGIVVVDPIPRTDKDMLQCVVRGGDEEACAAPGVPRPGEPEMTEMWQRITDRPGITPLNLDEFFCPGGTCPAIVDGIVARRDLQHLTVDYVSAIVDDLDAELRRQGVNLEAGTITRTPTSSSATSTPAPAPSQIAAPGDAAAAEAQRTGAESRGTAGVSG